MRFGIVTSGKGMKKGTEDFERVLKFIEDTTAEKKFRNMLFFGTSFRRRDERT